jgi:GntR family transcriptional regulator
MQNKVLTIKVDPKAALPAYEQIKQAIKLAILSGRLEEGDRLTSLRELALKLKVNPNTIIKVYYQLEVEGYVYSRPGAGYFVKLDPEKIQMDKQELFKDITGEYVSKALQLGYTLDEIGEEISEALSERVSKKTHKD